MDLTHLPIHQEFPAKVWVVIEQVPGETARVAYHSPSGQFIRTEHLFLGPPRGYPYAYGWATGLGTPPQKHTAVYLITEQAVQPGSVLEGTICGVYVRQDGNHKLVALDQEHLVSKPDLPLLNLPLYRQITGLYPQPGPGEGWFGQERALEILQELASQRQGSPHSSM